MIAILFVSMLLTVFMILPSALITYTVNVILGLTTSLHLDFWSTTIALAYLFSLAVAIAVHRKAKRAEKAQTSTGKVIDHE